MPDPLAQPFPPPCGAILGNRLCKAAMTEGLGDARLRATERLDRLYEAWSEGGAGLLLTGNVMIDHRVLERPGNVAIDPTFAPTVDAAARDRLRRWAAAGTRAGNHLWMQVSHAGRQSPRYVTCRPVAPSDVQLDLMGNYARPRALREDEIEALVRRFGEVAAIARDTGFTGVQVHGAHGYLISSFLSPVTNRRTDAWGGSLANRARFLLEVVRSVRRAVGPDFPVSVKLNSDDFRKGGFSHADCLGVVQMLNGESVDLLEISGGNYEQPRLLGISGRDGDAVEVRASTRVREAYFLDYATAIRRVAAMPLMVTGGFRTRAGMEAALASGDTDVIGIGRPFCTHPDVARRLLDREIDELPAFEHRLHLRPRGRLSPASPWLAAKMVNVLGAQGWYYQQMERLADARPIEPRRGMLRSFARYWWNDLTRAAALRRRE
ncbi:NADH:flavin oxidoreductase/NADH oxidase family protein [Arenimonas caeni]|uniref:NADH:flavin oxidoreductase n=1 Tax=Arenimonas caeni TaxID=2058085 RepID=A0A2P6MCL3_9GAMM|nr:NADH:flavin oxidoreductase/NADH oxidase family protein [Arenimonas caeni]PRH83727.1 NADH:flavin oxidoreductase [Arenimonas caeni]